jgi:hypothetical protein
VKLAFTLREEQTLGILENMALKGIFEPNEEDVI